MGGGFWQLAQPGFPLCKNGTFPWPNHLLGWRRLTLICSICIYACVFKKHCKILDTILYIVIYYRHIHPPFFCNFSCNCSPSHTSAHRGTVGELNRKAKHICSGCATLKWQALRSAWHKLSDKMRFSNGQWQRQHMFHILSIYLNIYLSISLVYQYTYLFISLSDYRSIYLSTYLPIHLSTYLSIYLSIYLSHLSVVYRSIYLASYLYIHLSINWSIYSISSSHSSLSIYLYLSLSPSIYQSIYLVYLVYLLCLSISSLSADLSISQMFHRSIYFIYLVHLVYPSIYWSLSNIQTSII